MPFPGASRVPEYKQYLEILSWKQPKTREGSTESPASQNNDSISHLYGFLDRKYRGPFVLMDGSNFAIAKEHISDSDSL